MTLVSDEAAYASESATAREHSAKAAEVLRTGISNVSLNDGTGKKNRPPLYVEAYVPIIDGYGIVRGVVEVYIDQTQTASLFKTTFAALAIGLALVAALTFGLPTMAYLLRSRQVSEARQRVEYLAHYEPMTGLLNRASFTGKLDEALQRREGGDSLSLVFLDLDDFKSINDSHGHEAGDEFLKHVANCITKLCRETDLVARPGGDEFLLALTGRSQLDAVELVERLMQEIGQPIFIRGKSISAKLSAGIYTVARDADAMADAMHKADVALYQAKLDGRNNYRLFSEDLENNMQARRELEQLIRKAAEQETFELHYQPLVQADNGACVGFEALLRLADGHGGYISPATCIPAIEAMGLINAVGKWVIEEAARTAATWPSHLFVSVNLSVRQFQGDELVGHVKQALAASGLRPKQLELEVTETLLMHNTYANLRQLGELRKLGVAIAMDDFGTGYSSLGYLWQFRFDKLKIDRSFVLALNHYDKKARDIIDTIIMLGHKLEMTVTAEGIETAHQAEVLSALACDHVQGFLYGHPIPASEIALFLLNNTRNRLSPPKKESERKPAVA
jgi:diguanylate cyclase (GGDEF)-like protein